MIQVMRGFCSGGVEGEEVGEGGGSGRGGGKGAKVEVGVVKGQKGKHWRGEGRLTELLAI